MSNLADWGPISPDSALPGYTGPSSDAIVDQDDPTKFFTYDYYAGKIADFQASLIQLDQQAQIMSNLLNDPDVTDPTDRQNIQNWLADYDAKRLEFRAAVKTVNGVVTAANAFGVGLPKLTLPSTLAQVQPIAIAGVAAALIAITALIEWGNVQTARAQAITQAVKTLPPDKLAAFMKQLADASGSSPLGDVASIVKWVAIGALIWFGFKAFAPMLRGGEA